jgi:hypothetical protein
MSAISRPALQFSFGLNAPLLEAFGLVAYQLGIRM